MSSSEKTPKFPLEDYRKFIREAASFVSLVAGRRLNPQDADILTDDEIRALGIQIDERAEALQNSMKPRQP